MVPQTRPGTCKQSVDAILPCLSSSKQPADHQCDANYVWQARSPTPVHACLARTSSHPQHGVSHMQPSLHMLWLHASHLSTPSSFGKLAMATRDALACRAIVVALLLRTRCFRLLAACSESLNMCKSSRLQAGVQCGLRPACMQRRVLHCMHVTVEQAAVGMTRPRPCGQWQHAANGQCTHMHASTPSVSSCRGAHTKVALPEYAGKMNMHAL